MMSRISFRYLIFIVAVTFFSCGKNNVSTPKPRGYFRITMPENKYQKFDGAKEHPFAFEYSTIARIDEKTDKAEKKNWLNIVYPQHDATIYITYQPIKNNLAQILEDTHHFTYGHTIKADAISESLYSFPEKHIYGLLSEIEGNAASPLQFFITDSIKNFIRGSLYFNCEPNQDSVAPVVDFIKNDVRHLMETIDWK